MLVSRLSSFPEDGLLEKQWRQMESDDNFCLGWTWLRSWWEHFGQGHDLYLLSVTADNGDVVAVAPWYLDKSSRRARTIRFLGSGRVCSDRMTILCVQGAEEAAAIAIGNWLVEANRSSNAADAFEEDHRWDYLDLDGVVEGDASIERLSQILDNNSSQVMQVPIEGYWRIEHGLDWEAYVSRLSKSMRSHVRQSVRRLIENDKAKLVVASDESSLMRGMEILVDLHQQRRNSLGDPGCFADDCFTDFLFDVSRKLLAENRLQLAWAEMEDQPVAIELNFRQGNTVFGYQTGISQDWLHIHPGRLLAVMVIRENQRQGIDILDQMRGDEVYKRHWGSKRIPLVRWRISSNRMTARLQHEIWRHGRNVKHWLDDKLSRS